jgi:hypothetical protein
MIREPQPILLQLAKDLARRRFRRVQAAKAGVKTDGRVVFQFYSEDLYKKLLALEVVHKGNRRVKDIRRTIFGVQSHNGQYEFYVIDQQFLGAS